jgi:ribonuclease P protein component
MLPGQNRLVSSQLKEVIRKGRVINSPIFVVRYISSLKKNSFSVVASSKVSKTAVGRNKIRRRVYSSMYKTLKDQKIGFNVVFFSKNSILNLKQPQIDKEVYDLFVKIGILL